MAIQKRRVQRRHLASGELQRFVAAGQTPVSIEPIALRITAAPSGLRFFIVNADSYRERHPGEHHPNG
jgi:hypothetical protein